MKKRTSIQMASLAVALFTLVLGVAGQTAPLQAGSCNCIPTNKDPCGTGKTCKLGGCSWPSPDSLTIGHCVSTGGHHGLHGLPDLYDTARHG